MLKDMQMRRPILLIFCALGLQCGAAGGHEATPDRQEAERLHAEAKQLMQAGRLAEAVVKEESAVELAPENAAIHRGLTAIYEQLHRTRQALDEALTAVRLDPGNAASHYNLGLLLSENRQFVEAVKEFQRAIAAGKDDLDTRRSLYQSMARTEQLKEAVAGLERLTQEHPNSKECWLELSDAYRIYGDGDGATLAVQKAVDLDPTWYPGVRFQAIVASGTRHWTKALLLAKRLIEMDPRNSDGYTLATMLLSDRDYAVGQWTLKQALQYQRGDTDLLVDLGRRFHKLGTAAPPGVHSMKLTQQSLLWLQLAEQALRSAVDAHPKSADANYNLARVLTSERKPLEALTYAKRAYELKPSDPAIRAQYQRSSGAVNDLSGELKRWLHGTKG